MAYTVRITRPAKQALRKIDRKDQQRIAARINQLAADPRPEGTRKLSGEQDLYRVRVGDYRVIYQVEDQALVVLVIRIGHRRDVYRRR